MCIYQNRRILNIREVCPGSGVYYGRVFPTTTGFAVSLHPWKALIGKYEEITTLLHEAKRVYGEIREKVISQLSSTILHKCNGCEINHPSQLQHDCLTLPWNDRVEDNFHFAMDKLCYSEITGGFKNNTFVGVDFCENMLSYIACNAKKMLFKS